MFSDELYFGCHACGKEAVGTPPSCYECGHDRHLALLNEAGEYPTQAQLDAHFNKYPELQKERTDPMKFYLKLKMLQELTILKIKYFKLNRSLAKIQKEIDKLSATWNND